MSHLTAFKFIVHCIPHSVVSFVVVDMRQEEVETLGVVDSLLELVAFEHIVKLLLFSLLLLGLSPLLLLLDHLLHRIDPNAALLNARWNETAIPADEVAFSVVIVSD